MCDGFSGAYDCWWWYRHLRTGMCVVFIALTATLKFRRDLWRGNLWTIQILIWSPPDRGRMTAIENNLFSSQRHVLNSPHRPGLSLLRVTAHQNNDNAWDHLRHNVVKVQLVERCLKVSLDTSEHRTKITTKGERSAGERGVHCARAGGAPGAGLAEHCCIREL